MGEVIKQEIYYIYFVNDEHNHVKIGIAKDIKKRILGMQVSCPSKLTILGTLRMENIEKAKEWEGFIHKEFINDSIRGEWFHGTPYLYEFIEAVNKGGLDQAYIEHSERFYNNYDSLSDKIYENFMADLVKRQWRVLDSALWELEDLVKRLKYHLRETKRTSYPEEVKRRTELMSKINIDHSDSCSVKPETIFEEVKDEGDLGENIKIS